MASSQKIFKTHPAKNDAVFVDKDIERITEYFNIMVLKISQLMEESSPKKVIILVGEQHFDSIGLFNEVLILFAAALAGVNNLLVEGSSKELESHLSDERKLKILNIAKLAKLARAYSWNVAALETDSTLPSETRDKIMAEKLLTVSTNSIAIVGMAHFYEIMNTLAENDKSVSVIGIKTISKGCDLFVLPKDAKLSSIFTLRPSYYVIQLNDDNKWMLFGVTNQLDKEATLTTKHELSALEIDSLKDIGIYLESENPAKALKLTDDQIKKFHDAITEEKKLQTLLPDEKLFLTEAANIIQTPTFKILAKYKKEEMIDLVVRILITKVFSPAYSQTCKLESAKLNPFAK